MNKDRLKQKLTKILDLIATEVDYAKKLDIENFMATIEEKRRLMVDIGEASCDDAEVQALAQKVRDENRRCAYLYYSATSMVRTSMNFIGEQSPVPTYGAQGKIHPDKGGGLIFSSEA